MNMTPMIDIVFLLIIFFLVSSHLARQETQLEIDLPDAATGDTPAEGERTRVTINLLPSGELIVGSEPTSIDQLAGRLAYEQAQAEERIEVRIRSDRQAPYGDVAPLLARCAKVGVWNVAFAVRERED